MASLKSNVPGTGGTYDDAFARIIGDTIDAPRYREDGEVLTPEQYAKNPKWSLETYLRKTAEELRQLNGQVISLTADVANLTNALAAVAGLVSETKALVEAHAAGTIDANAVVARIGELLSR